MRPKNSQPLVAKIRLKNLTHNLIQIKNVISPKTKIMAVVKANAYGHGLLPIAKHLHFQGVNYYAVARPEEALALRKALSSAHILILSPVPAEFFPEMVRNDITLTLASSGDLKKLARVAKREKLTAKIHLKIDTGLNRAGCKPEEVDRFLRELSRHTHIQLEGVFTHFADSGNDDKFTRQQINIFEKAALPIKKIYPKLLLHAANSSAIFKFPKSHFDLVRPGLALYGHLPFKSKKIKLKPLLTLQTRINRVHLVRKGETIGYDRTFKAGKDLLVATIIAGYGDGIRRTPLPWPYAEINRQIAPIIGLISMDQITLDVSRIKKAPTLKTLVTLLSEKGPCSLEAITARIGTSPYEVLTGLSGSRIARVYYF